MATACLTGMAHGGVLQLNITLFTCAHLQYVAPMRGVYPRPWHSEHLRSFARHREASRSLPLRSSGIPLVVQGGWQASCLSFCLQVRWATLRKQKAGKRIRGGKCVGNPLEVARPVFGVAGTAAAHVLLGRAPHRLNARVAHCRRMATQVSSPC